MQKVKKEYVPYCHTQSRKHNSTGIFCEKENCIIKKCGFKSVHQISREATITKWTKNHTKEK